MNRDIYYQGDGVSKYGIWDTKIRNWNYDVREDSPMLAMARLFFLIGVQAKSGQYSPRILPRV